LDTTVRLVTPERITFQYPLAGPFRRALAYLIDFLFWLLLCFVVFMILVIVSLGTTAGLGLIFVAFFVLQWGYSGFCEAVFNGRTLGKRMMGLRVVSDQGVPITGGQAILRNLLWTAEWVLPFAFLPALASMLLTRKFQRLGDLAAGTMVVVETRPGRGGLVRLDEATIAPVMPWLPARLDAGPELAQALSDYVKHRARFGPARREEMAGHLARPLRKRFGLPENLSSDAIVCALYQRVFLGG
jgi:uncharacterized RDD family membrane protein YckC